MTHMHSRQAKSGQFPLVCVDEAGFTLDPPLLPILAAAQRLILVLSSNGVSSHCLDEP